MKGYFYILRNTKGHYYIGSTNNLSRRIKEHQRGNTQSTRHANWKLIFSQEYNDLIEARAIERKIKSFKRKDIVERIIKDRAILTSAWLTYIRAIGSVG